MNKYYIEKWKVGAIIIYENIEEYIICEIMTINTLNTKLKLLKSFPDKFYQLNHTYNFKTDNIHPRFSRITNLQKIKYL